jgi:regulator of replication initiation timing
MTARKRCQMSEVSTLRLDNAQLKKELGGCALELTFLRKSLADEQREHDTLKTQINDLQLQLSGVAKLRAANEQLTVDLQELEALKRDDAELKVERAALVKEFDQLRNDHRCLAPSLRAPLPACAGSCLRVCASVETLTCHRYTSTCERTIADLLSDVEDLRHTLSQQKDKNAALQKELEDREQPVVIQKASRQAAQRAAPVIQ